MFFFVIVFFSILGFVTYFKGFCFSFKLFVIIKDEDTPYNFYVEKREIRDTLDKVLLLNKELYEDSERVIDILYQPQALFKVRAISRCTATIEGHAEAVISTQFSPDGK